MAVAVVTYGTYSGSERPAGPVPPDKSRPYPSHGTGSVKLGGLGGIQRETA